MRRLDESLSRLAERGERVGADVLLERIEQRLELGGDPVVVALDPRRTDMQTQQQTPTKARGPLIAAAAFGAAVVIAVATLVAINARDEAGLIAGQPPGPLDTYVAALQVNDADAALVVVSGDAGPGFTPWLVELDTSGIEFNDCRVNEPDIVTCITTFGPDFFYNRIAGDDLASVFNARIRNGRLTGLLWPSTSAIDAADDEFRAWVVEAHPERFDVMYVEGAGRTEVRFSAESGAARSELLDEFLASR